VSRIPELGTGTKLLHVVEGWLRHEKDERRRRVREAPAGEQAAAAAAAAQPRASHPHMPSKHMAFYR
jgi:hypothetical protein